MFAFSNEISQLISIYRWIESAEYTVSWERKRTHDFACPVCLLVDQWEVKDESTEDEDGAVKVLPLRLIDNWGQDKVAGHQGYDASDDNWHL